MDTGLPSALVVCLTTVCGGKKGPGGSSPSPPSVCLADQETTPCIIHYVYSYSLPLYLFLRYTHTFSMCMPKYEKEKQVKNRCKKQRHKCMSIKQANMNDGMSGKCVIEGKGERGGEGRGKRHGQSSTCIIGLMPK